MEVHKTALRIVAFIMLLSSMLHAWTTIETLDLASTDPELGLFSGGFAFGEFGYLIPSGEKTKVARFRLDLSGDVEVLNLAATDPQLRGGEGSFVAGDWAYIVPFDRFTPTYLYHGYMARFSLQDFNTVESLDLEAVDPELRGFYGGFAHGDYGYLVPRHNAARFNRGKVARFRLADFGGVEVLDLPAKNSELTGLAYSGGFADGTYGYFIPISHGGALAGRLVRVRLDDFDTVEVLDLNAIDSRLFRWHDGFVAGEHGYLLPMQGYSADLVQGKIVRFLLADWTAVEVLDMVAVDPSFANQAFAGCADGEFGYVSTLWSAPNPNKLANFRLDDFTADHRVDWTSLNPELGNFGGMFCSAGAGYLAPTQGGSKVVKFSFIIPATATHTTTRTQTSQTMTITGTTITNTTSTTTSTTRMGLVDDARMVEVQWVVLVGAGVSLWLALA